MIGIIDVGGGMRDIYGAGVLDACLENGVRFDLCVGISAGSANLLSYISGQKGRSRVFYTEYAFRPAYMSWRNLLRNGSYLNLDYMYGTLAKHDGENPLDYPAFAACGSRFLVVATDAETGKPHLFTKADFRQDDYAPIKASTCVPVVNRPYRIGDRRYFDGGISDPIPFERAFREGCDRVVIVLTRPRDERRDPARDRTPARLLRVRYPGTADALATRAQTYNAQLEAALGLEKEGRVLVVAPKSTCGMKTLTKDHEAMLKLYRAGLADAEKVIGFTRR